MTQPNSDNKNNLIQSSQAFPTSTVKSPQNQRIAEGSDTLTDTIKFIEWGITVLGGIGSIFQSDRSSKPAKEKVETRNQAIPLTEGGKICKSKNAANINKVSQDFYLNESEKTSLIEKLGQGLKERKNTTDNYGCLPIEKVKDAARKLLKDNYLSKTTSMAAKTFAALTGLKVGTDAALITISRLEKVSGDRGIENLKRGADTGLQLLKSGKIRNPAEIANVLTKAGSGILEQYKNKAEGKAYDKNFSSGSIRELEVAKRLIDRGISKDIELGGKRIYEKLKIGGDVVDHTNQIVYQVKTVNSASSKEFWNNYEKAVKQLKDNQPIDKSEEAEILPKDRYGNLYGKAIDIKITNPNSSLYDISAKEFANKLNGKTSPTYTGYTGKVVFTNKNGTLELELKNGKVATPKEKIVYRASSNSETDTSLTASTIDPNTFAPQSISQANNQTSAGTSNNIPATTSEIDQNPSPTTQSVTTTSQNGLTPSSTALTGTVVRRSPTALTGDTSTTALTGWIGTTALTGGTSTTALTGSVGTTALTGGTSTTALTGSIGATALTGGKTQEPSQLQQGMALS